MQITVNRIISNADATLSTVYVDDRFVCFGLEDEFREHKVSRETRIPAGHYPITLRTVGGFHSRYERKFSEFHRGMLWVRNVPGFEYILIHIGNTDEDTAGCLLVGQGDHSSGELRISESSLAYAKLYQQVLEAAAAEELSIEYLDKDN